MHTVYHSLRLADPKFFLLFPYTECTRLGIFFHCAAAHIRAFADCDAARTGRSNHVPEGLAKFARSVDSRPVTVDLGQRRYAH
jgi:hypothetical protein